jgi:hypothetical protein
MATATRDTDQDQAAHVRGLATKKKDGQKEHQDRADQPVLYQRQAEHALVAEYFSQLFVADLG